jgi:hypothetical protein
MLNLRPSILLLWISLFGLVPVAHSGIKPPPSKPKSGKEIDPSEDEAENVENFKRNDKDHYIEFEWRTLQYSAGKGEPIPVVLYRVRNDKGILVKAAFGLENGKCSFRLPLDQTYTIQISKPGYLTKYLILDAHLPGDINSAFIFPIEVSLWHDYEGLDSRPVSEPVARIAYSDKAKEFEFDPVFAAQKKPALDAFTKQYIKAQQKAKTKTGPKKK